MKALFAFRKSWGKNRNFADFFFFCEEDYFTVNKDHV